MKKVLLVLLALFSLVGLTSCGKVEAKKLEISGSKAKEKDLDNFKDDIDEYLEGNEFENQWYSVAIYSDETYDEYLEYTDYKRTVEAKGSYYFSKFAYEQKVKITATVTVSYENEDGDKEESVTEITYIYKDGKEYCKEVVYTESENTTSKIVNYNDGSFEEMEYSASLYDVDRLNGLLYGAIESIAGLDKIYKSDNGFSGEMEMDEDDYGFDGLYQVVYEYDEETYQLKKYEAYTSQENDDYESVSYLCVETKLFGIVNAPSNAEKYN